MIPGTLTLSDRLPFVWQGQRYGCRNGSTRRSPSELSDGRQVLNPPEVVPARPVANARPLKHQALAAVVLFGVGIVTPAWAALLAWLALTAGSWIYEGTCVCVAYLMELLQANG